MQTNTITKDYLISLVENTEVVVQSAVFFDKETVVSIKLPCGFTVSGRSACVDPANFVKEIGEKIAFDDAIDKLWQLEGYVLQLKLSGQITDNRH